MGVKLFVLGAVLAIIIGFTSADSPLSFSPCSIEKKVGLQCTECNFLTFGQEKAEIGGIASVSYFCPLDDLSKTYCCYDPFRRPFCCNQSAYIISGLIWLAAAVVVIYIVSKLVKCLIF